MAKFTGYITTAQRRNQTQKTTSTFYLRFLLKYS